MSLLPKEAVPTNDLSVFLEMLARRMGMLKRGGEVDVERAAVYFVKWWREEGALLSATSGFQAGGVGASPALKSGSRTDLEGGVESAGERLEFLGQGNFPRRQAWGFDFEWELRREDVVLEGHKFGGIDARGGEGGAVNGELRMKDSAVVLHEKMERCIEEYIEKTDREEVEEKNVSSTQVRKRMFIEEKEKRKAKWAAKRHR